MTIYIDANRIAPDNKTPGQRARHDARELTGSDGTAEIVLDSLVYTLRITRQGKLILTK